jgi:uncharacterized protein YbjT (DUF2867 family)
MAKNAVVFGATGLVGNACLDLLLADARYGQVHVVGRRPPARTHAKLIAHSADLGQGDALATLPVGPVDEVMCCLGTTIAKAGSQQAFRRVDFEYVSNAAKFAKAIGAAQFLLVSSVGADARSNVFYTRVKGETEEAVAGLGIPSVGIFRPSLILGPRGESRLFEQVAKALMQAFAFALVGSLSKYRPIHAATIARAMLGAAALRAPGTSHYEYDRMTTLASGTTAG